MSWFLSLVYINTHVPSSSLRTYLSSIKCCFSVSLVSRLPRLSLSFLPNSGIFIVLFASKNMKNLLVKCRWILTSPVHSRICFCFIYLIYSTNVIYLHVRRSRIIYLLPTKTVLLPKLHCHTILSNSFKIHQIDTEHEFL